MAVESHDKKLDDLLKRVEEGKTILVETKGDHLVNDDSKNKILLGNK